MAPFLVSDALDLTTRMRAVSIKAFRFDKERSAVTIAQGVPENIEIEALLTYSPERPRRT